MKQKTTTKKHAGYTHKKINVDIADSEIINYNMNYNNNGSLYINNNDNFEIAIDKDTITIYGLDKELKIKCSIKDLDKVKVTEY